MDSINRLSSPMALYQEDLQDNPLQQEQLRESVRRGVAETPASFLIGSMEMVNHKIAQLELELRACGSEDLVIPTHEAMTRPSAREASLLVPEEDGESIGHRLQQQAATRERDRKELWRFAQKYERSMHSIESGKYPHTKQAARKKLMAPPRLVELQLFPGFLEDGPTPMPNGMPLSTILENVVAAHSKTRCKFCSPKDLQKFLSILTIRAIVLDSFWWIFLHKYQSDPGSQTLLFDRIAESYVHLLHQSHMQHCGEAFLNDFPSVLSQAVYSCFCFSFPESGVQFHSDEFQTLLCNTLWEWIGGIRPSPGVYNSWDYGSLEPKKLGKEEGNSGNDGHKTGSPISFLRLDHSGPAEGVRLTTSRHSRLRCGSLPRLSSKTWPSLEPEPSKHSLDLSSLRSNGGLSRSSSLPVPGLKHLRFQTEGQATLASVTPLQTKLFEMSPGRVEKESHPACLGPDFTRHLFNVNGRSPLVQHYLRQQGVEPRAVQDTLVRRTEVQLAIPSSSETYASLIHQGYRRLHQVDGALQALYQKHSRESAAFSRSQRDAMRDFLRKEKLILSQKSEVKRLSQLVFPATKDSEGKTPEEVGQALGAALTAQV